MKKVLMRKGNVVHYVPYETVKEFENHGWSKVDLTEKAEKAEETTTKTTTKRKAKKSN